MEPFRTEPPPPVPWGAVEPAVPAGAGVPDPEEPPESGPASWRPWTAPAALAAGVVLAAVGGLLVDIPAAVLFGVKIESSHLPAGLEIADTAVQDVAFVAAAVIFAQLGGRAVAAWQLGLRPPRLRLRRAVGAVALTLVAFLVFTAVWASVVEVSTKEKLLEQLGTNSSTALLLASAALTCVLAPVCEEILFRGYFFPALSNWKGRPLAAVLTGAVFGGVHAGSAPLVDLVPLAALGMALCVLYRWSGSLYPCIAVHIVNNSVAFGGMEGWGWQILVLLACALGSVAALVAVLRRSGVIGDPPAEGAAGEGLPGESAAAVPLGP